MFKIEPVQDKEKQKELCGLFGCEFAEDFFSYYMYDMKSGKPMGFSQFEINGNSGFIKDLTELPEDNDVEAMFILGRQTMNFINACGGIECYAADNGNDPRLLHAIGFRKNDDGEWRATLEGMFDGKCDGHEVKL